MTKVKQDSVKVVEFKEAEIVKKEIVVVEDAKKLKITSEKGMEKGAEILSVLNKNNDNVTAILKSITAPAKESVKAAESVFKPYIKMYEDAIDKVRGMMSEYQTEKVRIADEEAAKIAARQGEGKGKFSRETVIAKLGDIERPESKIAAASGSVAFRTDPTFEVVDISKLPVKYILPNDVEIRAAMKAGIQLPGVKYGTKQTPINNR